MRKNKLLAIAVGALSLLSISAYGVEQAFAYTVNNGLASYGYVVKNSGSYTLAGGDSVTVGNSGPYTALYGQTIHLAQEQFNAGDGQGPWGVMLGDMQGADANNGYLLIADDSMGSTNVDDVVNRIGGNLSYVQNYLQTQNQQILTKDLSNGYVSYTYVPFASVISESGAKFGTKTATATGQDYNGNPIYVYNYPIEPSAPPSATSLSVTDAYTDSSTITQGDPIDFSAQSNIPLWAGLSAWHYDAIQITNSSTGQSVWAVQGNGSYNIGGYNMLPVAGGHGTYTDSTVNGDIPSYSSSNLQPGNYTAIFWVSDGVHRLSSTPATASFTVTSGQSSPSSSGNNGLGATISFNPSTNQSLDNGQSVTLSYTTTGWQSGDYVSVVPAGNQYITDSWVNNDDTNSADSTSEKESAPDGVQATVSYTAYLYNSYGQVIDQAQSGLIHWNGLNGIITISASSTKLSSGQYSTISYSVSNMGVGDTVTITGQGGQDMWNVQGSANATDSYMEKETPVNGASTTVNYTANLYNPFGALISDSSVSVTWTSPVPDITVTANPTNLVAGQPATISYSTTVLPSGDYVKIVGTGGSNAWNTTNLTNPTDNYTEVENPSSGQQITTNYTGYIYNSQGQIVAQSSASATWTNAWTGTLQLSANPLSLPVGSPTTLTATASMQTPLGYSLVIVNESTGQIVGMSGQSSLVSEYTSYSSGPENFIAEMSDGYENVGTSNQVQVTWNTLSLMAQPSVLPSGSATTLTSSTNSILAGDIMWIEDMSTGQVVAQGSSATLTTSYTSANAETDTFTAFIGPSIGNSTLASNSVTVQWYGLVLTVSPTKLPTGHSTTLTATTTNLPSGYVIEIINDTTNQVIATGQVGQTSITTQQAKTTAQTDKYYACITFPAPSGLISIDQSSSTLLWYDSGSWASFPQSPSGVANAQVVGSNVYVELSNGEFEEWNGSQWLNFGYSPLGQVVSGGAIYTFFIQPTDGALWVINPSNLTQMAEYSSGSWKTITSPIGALPPSSGSTSYSYRLYYFGYDNSGPVVIADIIQNNYVNGNFYSNFYSGYAEQYQNGSWTQTSGASSVYWGYFGTNGDDGNGITFGYDPKSDVLYEATPYRIIKNGNGTRTGTNGNIIPIAGTLANAAPVSAFGPWSSLQPAPNGGEENYPADEVQFVNVVGNSNLLYLFIENSYDSSTGAGTATYVAYNLDSGANYTIGSAVYGTGSTSYFLESMTANGTSNYVSYYTVTFGYAGTTWAYYIQQFGSSVQTLPNPNGTDGVRWLAYLANSTNVAPLAKTADIAVTWFNVIVPPDNPMLTALPTNVVKPAPTQFLVNFDASDANFVNQQLGGSAPVQIYNVFTWRPVATGTWSPSSGMSLTIPYNPVPGGSSQYLAFLEDTNKHPLAVSNQVTVTDTGNGKLGNSYSELVCGPNGDGTEIFQNYQNGKLVSSRTVPLTLANLNINGIFNPTQQLKDEYPGMTIKLPVTNAELSYGPIPLRVQAPFGFAVQFPDAQPTKVTATFTVNEGYAVDMQGDTSWTVNMKPAPNQPLYWQGATIMPKLPDGVHIMVKIVAEDDCGTNMLVNNDFVTTSGRPQWYFVQPTKPGSGN